MITYLLFAFGLAYIVGHSTISLPFRIFLGGTPAKHFDPLDLASTTSASVPAKPGALGPLGDFLCALIECPACFGFWIGLGYGFTGLLAPPADLIAVHYLWPVMLGCVTAGSNYAVSRLTRLI